MLRQAFPPHPLPSILRSDIGANRLRPVNMPNPMTTDAVGHSISGAICKYRAGRGRAFCNGGDDDDDGKQGDDQRMMEV